MNVLSHNIPAMNAGRMYGINIASHGEYPDTGGRVRTGTGEPGAKRTPVAFKIINII